MTDKKDRSDDVPTDPIATLEQLAARLKKISATIRKANAVIAEVTAKQMRTTEGIRDADAALRRIARVADGSAKAIRTVTDARRSALASHQYIHDRCAAANEHFRKGMAILNGSRVQPQHIPSLPGAPDYRTPAAPQTPRLPPPLPRSHVKPAPLTDRPPAPPKRPPIKKPDTARLDAIIAFPRIGTPRRGIC